MSPIASAAILLAELWLLGITLLATHRFIPRFGKAPFFILLGALAAALQTRSFGMFEIQAGGLNLAIAQGSVLILPVLMMGLLIIYVVEGTNKARVAWLGLILVTVGTAVTRVLPPLQLQFPGISISTQQASGLTATSLLASALTLGVDLVILVIVYQWVSNMRKRLPSLLASNAALLAAVWSDGLLYPILAFTGLPDPGTLLVHLISKSLAVVALWPLMMFYLYRIAPAFPDSAAASPRPTLDLFTTTIQLEARARYHYSLLQTLSQINQMLVRATDPQTLLEQACQLLVEGRDYQLAWIGLLDEDCHDLNCSDLRSRKLHIVARYSSQAESQDFDDLYQENSLGENSPVTAAIHTGKPFILKNITQSPKASPWRRAAQANGFRSMAAFPMRHNQSMLGVIRVYTRRTKIFDQEEVDLMQELADDLAYALVSLEARRQQTLLDCAAESTHDGLIITDLQGNILFTNPTMAKMVGSNIQDMKNANVRAFLPPELVQDFNDPEILAQLKDGQFGCEFEQQGADGHGAFLSLRATLTTNENGHMENVMISVHDITHSHRYQRQLLSLNRLTADLVQIHDPEALLQAILNVCESLLHAKSSAIYMLNQEGNGIGEVYSHKLSDGYIQQIRQNFHDLPGERAVLLSQMIAVGDVTKNPRYRERLRFMEEYGIQAIMMLPILFQGKALGVLGLYYDQPQDFSEEEKQLGLTAAHTLAIALQNARLHQAETSHSQLAEALAQATAALNSSLQLDEVLDRILEQTARVVPCQSVNLMLVEGNEARVARHLDYADPCEAKRLVTGNQFRLSLPTLQKMIVTGQPVLVANTRQHALWQKLEGGDWIRSYAGAPLCIRQHIIGFLNVNSDQENFFNEESAHRLQAFAATAATAIHNASLYQNLQEHTLELESRVLNRTAELRAAKEHIEHVLASVPDAVIVLDSDDQMVQANPAGEALIIQAAVQAIDLFEPRFLARLKRGVAPDEKTILEIQSHSYQALASRLPVSGQGNGLVIVFRDVTRLRELDQIKSQFVSDVSHELRTPLTNLTIYLELLATQPDRSKSLNYLNTLRRETERLTHLIEDLLTISRLEAGRVHFHLQPIDINLLVAHLAEDRASMAASSNLSLKFTSGPDLPPALVDPSLVTQVLSNLLTNAMNYTPSNGKLHLFTELRSCYGKYWVTASIQDTGVGIQPEEAEMIFERFFRGSASARTGAPGTGLGLAISKEILDRLGGFITVESSPGKGSTFTVWLPAAEPGKDLLGD